jgi:flagellar hook assembly protein FlgD
MKSNHRCLFSTALLLLALGGCESKPKPPMSVEPAEAAPNSIREQAKGLAPAGDVLFRQLTLAISFGDGKAVKTWSIAISDQARTIRTIRGGATELPESISWDGRDDSGNLAAEGSYDAVLAVDYGGAYRPSLAKSGPFSLVTTPPRGSVTHDPPDAVLTKLGPESPVTLTVEAKSSFARIVSWTLGIIDGKGETVASFQADWPDNNIVWDGASVADRALASGGAYTLVAKVRDEYGNVGELKGSIAIEARPAQTAPLGIQVLSAGFAPTGDGTFPRESLAFGIGDPASVVSWKVDIADDSGNVARTFAGAGGAASGALSWDGKEANGKFAPEGLYKAILTVDRGSSSAPMITESKNFALDISPPIVMITLSTDLFSPEGDGKKDTMTIALDGSSKLPRIVSWSMTIYDPGNDAFVSRGGSWPAGPIIWDGRNSSGELVESASVYPIDVILRDEFGNIGEMKKNLNTDIQVLKSGDGYRMRVASVYFKALTSDYWDVPFARAAHNIRTLDLLAAKLAKFPGYRIKVEGHVVMDDNDAKTLVALSEGRAEAIKDALIERGIPSDRLAAVGVGSRDPIVPDSDFPNRWKNGRLEVYLTR